MNYVQVDFNVKKALDLKLTEYCFLAVVDYMAYNAANHTRWCYASRKTLAERIDVSERYIYTITQRMVEKGLLEEDTETGNMRTTPLWFQTIDSNKREYEQSSDGMNRVQKNMNRVQKGMNRVQKNHEQSSYNNNIYSNKEKEEDNTPAEAKIEPYSFNDFWLDYDKKEGKVNTQKKWKKLTDKDKVLIQKHVASYKKKQPDKKYRKNPEAYLNSKMWLDEIEEGVLPQKKEQPKPFTIDDYENLFR
jgi:hypothetical protein